MIPTDLLYGEHTIAKLLQYHGRSAHQCPIDPSHELTVASDSYAVCHDCGLEWDAVSLNLDLTEVEQTGVASSQQKMPEVAGEKVLTMKEFKVEAIVKPPIFQDFTAWVRANSSRLYDTTGYDGDHSSALGYVTLKSNLCLLPSATRDLTVSQLRSLEETWLLQNLVRLPEDKRGLKRSARIPQEIVKAQGYKPALRLYTFHQRETANMLSLTLSHSKTA